MNYPAMERKERIIKLMANKIKTYDGIFDPTNNSQAKMLAEDIYKSLIKNKYLKGYEA